MEKNPGPGHISENLVTIFWGLKYLNSYFISLLRIRIQDPNPVLF
jgi:hypothetical protein